MIEITDSIFREQVQEDINFLKQKLSWDSNIAKDEYTFNYWILTNIYNLDEEECTENITEYNDKGIDCFVHYEEDKTLYIIQNKYYGEKTTLNSKDVSDFMTRPIAKLEEGNYTRSPELQKIYNKVKNDKDYKIFLHFFIFNDKKNVDVNSMINNYKHDKVLFQIFFLKDIKEKYFGESFSKNAKLNTTLKVKNKGTYLAIRPTEYNLPNMSEAYYVMAKVVDVFNLWKSAQEKDYPLFEENIREYLGGTSGINKAIINTLKNPSERGNFFYYNNGITIICEKAKADSQKVDISNPQIVNGCQTVNSIAAVLDGIDNPEKEFNEIYVMVKILILDKKNTSFYRDIVKYTNSQNSINEKVFGATLQPFFTIQDKLKSYGILLSVKQSDKFQFKDFYKEKKELLEMITKANNFSKNIFQFKNLIDLELPLETLIQIIGAYHRDAHLAYTKKSFLLKPTSKEYYQAFSIKINEYFTIESMAKLVLLYKKSEKEKKDSIDKRTPSPYFLLNFLGFFLKDRKIDLHQFIKNIEIEDLFFVYEKFKTLSSKYVKAYSKEYNLEYNQIIKQKIDLKIMENTLISHLNSLEEYNNDDYVKLEKIIANIKNK